MRRIIAFHSAKMASFFALLPSAERPKPSRGRDAEEEAWRRPFFFLLPLLTPLPPPFVEEFAAFVLLIDEEAADEAEDAARPRF